MKKKIILWCLLLILVLSSCAPDEMDETGKIEKQERLSIELPTENVVAKHEISERYVLVETQLSGNAPKFDLYDLEKGEMYNLPTMPEYVVLEEILNENYYVFRTTGENSESVDRFVPEMLKCFRVYDKASAFEATREPICFNLTESVVVGTEQRANAEHADVDFGIRDICIGFSSREGSEKSVDGFPLLPCVEIKGSGENRALVININKMGITTEVYGEETIKHNPYVKEYEMEETMGGVKLVVHLEDKVEGFFVDVSQGEYPSIKLSFE